MRKKWDTKGIEPSEMQDTAIENYNLDVMKSTDLGKLNGEFDIITM